VKRIVILGAGTAGTMMANKLARALPESAWAITVVDRDDVHVYQPGLLFIPFGDYRESQILRSRRALFDPRVDVRLCGIERIEPDKNQVALGDGSKVTYDILIVATGSRILPEQTPGLANEGWRKTAFDFYTVEGAKALAATLDGFKGGRFVVNVVEMPIKCPVAPLELLFLADAYFTKRGIRDKVEITYATPLVGAFTRPICSGLLGNMLEKRNISIVADFNTSEVVGEKKLLKSFDGRDVPYDLLVSIPLHSGADVIAKSGMGDAGGWFPTHKHTLQSKHFRNVFALGDATDLPASKAGAVAHFQADVLLENLLRFIDEREVLPAFDGHANCFIETGFGKAMLIDFNYETEPLPGRFPLPGVGPFTLLEESAVNHWGKLAFKWVYWNQLLPGKELPLDHRMLMAGKWS